METLHICLCNNRQPQNICWKSINWAGFFAERDINVGILNLSCGFLSSDVNMPQKSRMDSDIPPYVHNLRI